MAEFEFQAPVTRRPIGRYVVIGVVVVVLIGILVWAIAVHQSHRASTNKPATSGQSTQGGAAQQSPTGSSPSSSDTSDNSSATPPPVASGTGSQQLANSGPGDVVGLFLGTALVGGLGYSFYLRRRLSRG